MSRVVLIDCIYIAASAHDIRFARICIASVRFFYPDFPVRLLQGGKLAGEFLKEVKNFWNVEPASIPPGDYGWGFVKYEPLFQDRPERFLVMDADTVMLGPVLDALADDPGDLIVDDEVQTDERAREIYYDWDGLRQIDPSVRRPDFFFNTGQWCGRSGALDRADFTRWVEWSLPRRLTRPDLFKNGEQGLLNYVVNEKARAGTLRVSRVPLMRWPGHDLGDIALAEVARGAASPYRQIVHWAGFKAARLETLPRADLLLHFERLYYQRHGGESLRLARAGRYAMDWHARRLRHKVVGRFARLRTRFTTP